MLRRLRIVPYLHDMAPVYASADLLVARAGAMTCSELAATGNASILIPLPSATDDHQTANARSMAEKGDEQQHTRRLRCTRAPPPVLSCSCGTCPDSKGAAILMPEKALTGRALALSIASLLSDSVALKQMQGCARALAPDRKAVEQVAEQVLSLANWSL